jgi:hypothetical protein
MALEKKKTVYKKILFVLLAVIIGWGVFQSLNRGYVRRLSDEGKCAAGLNFYQCAGYTDLGNSYQRLNDDIYYHIGWSDAVKLEGADVETFEVIRTNTEVPYFAKDKNHVYVYGKVIPTTDVASWKFLSGFNNRGYSSDKNSVFFGADVLPGADPKTFSVIEYDYACSPDFVYRGSKIIEGADPGSFVTLLYGGLTRDDTSYFFYGERSGEVSTEHEEDGYRVSRRCEIL